MAVEPPTASEAIPRGWNVDHQQPNQFVVRCSACGRLDINESRANAHRRADTHALHCESTGVTPVSTPSESTEENLEAPLEDAAVLDDGLDVQETDLVGRLVDVQYDSAASGATMKTVTGEIVAMLPATTDVIDDPYRGFVLRLPDERRLRVDVFEAVVECPHNTDSNWRRMGDLRRVAPTVDVEAPRVMTDGGSRPARTPQGAERDAMHRQAEATERLAEAVERQNELLVDLVEAVQWGCSE